jgi:hypothetical protein
VEPRFFDAVICEARALELLSDEYFSVDGALIEAWAPMKFFRSKDGGDRYCKGERRCNETHASATDLESKLLRKLLCNEARLRFAGRALVDNRHRLIRDVWLTSSVAVMEPEASLSLVARQGRKRLRPGRVGGDKDYHTQRFGETLLAQRIAPHVALNVSHHTTGIGESC